MKKFISIAAGTAAAFALLAGLFSVSPATADQNPPGCTASGVGLSLEAFRADGVTPIGAGTVASGETIKYKATLSHLGGSNCNYELGTLTITAPDGAVTDVTGGGIPLITSVSSFTSVPVSYVVSYAHSGGDGILDATANYSGGTSHTPIIHSTVGASNGISVIMEGHIIVDKVTNPSADPQSFDFDAVGSGYNDFSLTDVATPNDQALIPVPDAYSVSETVPGGWSLATPVCISSLGDTESAGSLELDAGETITCTFTNTEKGHVIIEKNAIPDSSQVFTFNNNFGSPHPATFTLTDDSTPDLPSYDAEVLPGTYAVSEDSVAGWQSPESATCDDGSPVSAIVVSPGETVTCTFVNEKLTTIILVKNTIGGDGTFDFNMTGSGLPASTQLVTTGGTDSETFSNLDPDNTYSIGEVVQAGWDLISATCDNGDPVNSITPNAGEEITCTFTNEKDSKIIVVKQTDPDGDQTQFDFTTSYGSPFMLSDGQSNDSGDLDPGTYAVIEAAEAGWDLESATCDDGSAPISIGLSAGETVTCTFINEKDAFIIVEKQTNPNGDPQVFDFTTSYGSPFSLSDGGSNNSGDLDPGTYSVGESVPAGWDLESVVCSDRSLPSAISLQAGETVTCVFTNEKDANIIVIKQTTPDGAAQVFDFSASWDGGADPDFSLSDGQSNDSGDLDPGIYSVSENVPTGWSLTGATCSGQSPIGTIDLQAGETVTCVFENLRLQQESRVETHVHDPLENDITGLQVPLGTTVHDKATVHGDGITIPTGNVSFDLYATGNCTGPTIIPTEILALNLGSVESTPVPNLLVGSYGYLVNYSGDQNYLPSLAQCEPFEIVKLPSEVITQIHDANHLDITNQIVPTGTQVHDQASVVLGAGPVPTGTVDFNLFSTVDCTGQFTTESGVPLDLLGQAESTQITPLAGPLSYLVTYGGDQNYLPSEGRCEPLTVKGPTRTLGFWQTHKDLAQTYLASVPVGEKTICGNTVDSIGKLMGGFWSSIPYKTTGVKRNQPDQAKMQLVQQYLAAILNKAAFGTDDGGVIALAQAACTTNNKSTILTAAGNLGNYNQSGDSIPSPFPTGSADPQGAQAVADKPFWNILP